MSEIITYSSCPVCGSKRIHNVMSAEDHTVSHEHFEVWECEDCSFRFTQNVPDEAHIGKYYSADAYISHSNTNKGLINRLYHYVRSITLKQKKNIIQLETGRKAGRLLDIGAGTGAFSAFMQKHRWEVLGLEPSDTARNNAKSFFNIDLHPISEFYDLKPQDFDVITMWHVLEHVHALNDYLDQLHKLLKADGTLFIAVPNYTSYDAKYYGANWAAWDVPRHLYHFSPESMTLLLQKHGFEVKNYLPMNFDSFYVSMLSEKYKRGKNSYLSALKTGFDSNGNMNHDAKKCSSVIYVIQKSEASL